MEGILTPQKLAKPTNQVFLVILQRQLTKTPLRKAKEEKKGRKTKRQYAHSPPSGLASHISMLILFSLPDIPLFSFA